MQPPARREADVTGSGGGAPGDARSSTRPVGTPGAPHLLAPYLRPRLTPGIGRPCPTGDFELLSWYFMRLSGIALIFLVLGHLAIMHVLGSVENVSADFVAQRLANPLWRAYDLTMVVLALLHGANGARWILNDYARSPRWRLVGFSLLLAVTFVFLVLASLVLLTWQPPAPATGSLTTLGNGAMPALCHGACAPRSA